MGAVALFRRTVARSEPPADTGRLKIEAAIADALAYRLRQGDLTPWQLPIVAACRGLIADTVAQLPLVAVRDGVARPDQPAVLRRPDPTEPRWLTLHRAVNNLTGAGRTWLRPVAWDAAGWPTAVEVLDPDLVTGEWHALTGRLSCAWYDGRPHRCYVDSVRADALWLDIPAGHRVHRDDQLVWIPWETTYRNDPGRGPLHACWPAVEYLAALWQMAGSFWEFGAPAFAIEVAQRLSAGQAQELKDQARISWHRSHEPAVLDGDAKLRPLGLTAEQSQLVQSIDLANAEVARAFRVTPSLVNVAAGDSLTYSTTAGLFGLWKRTGLAPYLTRLEGGFTDLVPYGTAARFDTDELDRADFQARATGYQAALAGAPWMTADEVRGREGLSGPAPAAATPAPDLPAGAPT